jgi:hypothetical protein
MFRLELGTLGVQSRAVTTFEQTRNGLPDVLRYIIPSKEGNFFALLAMLSVSDPIAYEYIIISTSKLRGVIDK